MTLNKKEIMEKVDEISGCLCGCASVQPEEAVRAFEEYEARIAELEAALKILADGELVLIHNIRAHAREALVRK